MKYEYTPNYLNLLMYKKIIPKDLREKLKNFVPKPEEYKLQVIQDLNKTNWDFGVQIDEPILKGTERAALENIKMVLHLLEVLVEFKLR